jgi:DNA-binding transcriptional LysR family regulator
MGLVVIVELQELRWAITAARYRSLRQAAEALNVRQPTLSRRLRNLEYHLGAQLFERTNGGTRPTVAGREFIETASRLVKEADGAFARLKTRCCGESGRLAIGIYASFSTGNLRATLSDHHRRFPDVDVHTVDGGHDKLLEELATHAIDIAIMTTRAAAQDDRALPLWSEQVILALPQQHPLSDHVAVHWQDLVNEPVLIPEEGPGPELEHLLATKLHCVGARQTLHQDVSLDRLLSLVAAGYGVLLMLEGATGIHYDGLVYREMHDDAGPTRLNFSAYWRQANGNPPLPPFLSMLRERYPDLSA